MVSAISATAKPTMLRFIESPSRRHRMIVQMTQVDAVMRAGGTHLQRVAVRQPPPPVAIGRPTDGS